MGWFSVPHCGRLEGLRDPYVLPVVPISVGEDTVLDVAVASVAVSNWHSIR